MSTRAPHGLPLGTVLGEVYRVGRRIAEGGMGSVYEAEHLRLGRRCAVKVMAPELAANTEALARFHREVEITAKLSHPHVVQVFDVGQLASGEPYLVMEYLDGEDLARRLGRVGRLPVATTLHIARQIASALAATHARGIIHRDLKPTNIFILAVEGSPDFVKVIDFGISKMPRAASRLTRASALVGTPEYMAPEQASGRIDALDHRTDQWALAAIVWEMFTGHPPFAAKEISALLFKIVHDPPAEFPAELSGPSTSALEAAMRKGLAKKQSDRFPTVHAFMRALEAAALQSTAATLAPGTGLHTRPAGAAARKTRFAALDPALVLQTLQVRPAPRRRWWWLAAAALPLAAGGVLWAASAGRGPGNRLSGVAPDRAAAASPHDKADKPGAEKAAAEPAGGKRHPQRR